MPNQIVVRPPFRKRGQQYFPIGRSLSLGSFIGSGGVRIGGSASTQFTHGPQVESDIVVEWDLNNDGQFDQPEEDITQYVLAVATQTGRDWPSLLTGKAAPGRLSITLDDTDGRFSYFNANSPLNQNGNSLKTGRRIRVRTSEASVDDPVLLYKDRFPRADGALGTPEYGAAWDGPLANDFVIQSQKAKPQTEGQVHIAVADSGADSPCYVQARFREVGSGTNVVGLVYRYVDSDDYSIAAVDVSAKQLKLINVITGVPDNFFSESIEIYDDVTIGVLNSGLDVTLYYEGIPMTSTLNFRSQRYHGLYASWGTGDVRPEVDDFYIWDGLVPSVTGILWTGDVSNLTPNAAAGPIKTAKLEGVGWLDRLAGLQLTPVRSVSGKPTGFLVGNTLARSNLLHPPMSIAEGDVTTGAVGLTAMNAIDAAREFEEVEFGFLKEAQEGPIVYEDRTHRDTATTVALFSDDPIDQFHYEDIEQLDFRRDVVNRVIAGVAPGVPAVRFPTPIGAAGSGGDVEFAIGSVLESQAGELQVVTVTVYHNSGSDAVWLTPPGWVEIAGTSGDEIPSAVDVFTNTLKGSFSRTLVRALDRTDSSTAGLQLTEGLTTGDSYSYFAFVIEDWFGNVADGIAVSDRTTLYGMDTPGDNPPVVFPPWGPAPSLFITFCTGLLGSAGFTGEAPLGYDGYDVLNNLTVFSPFTETAYRTAAVEVENPGSFNHDYGGDDGWVEQSYVIAIRGDNGGVSNGVLTVEANDLDSQDDHNVVRTYTNASNLFATEADAETYAELVLSRYADDRPILRISFTATKSGAYRTQAVYRRVGDRITLDASNNAGLGIEGDFFIETISHQWSNGNTKWVTTWDLSPVPVS